MSKGDYDALDVPRIKKRRLPSIGMSPESFGKASESFARFMGTPQFLIGMTVFCFVWLAWNTLMPEPLQFDPRALNFTLLTLILSLQASYAAPLILLAENRSADRDRVEFENDRQRAERNLADTEFLTREIAGLRLAVQEVATRDFVRGELRGVQDDLRDDLREALRAELREEIREEIRAELRAGLPGAEAQPRKNKKTKGRGRDARRGDAGAEPTTTTLATLAAQEAQEAREAGGSGPVTGPAGGAGPVDGGGR